MTNILGFQQLSVIDAAYVLCLFWIVLGRHDRVVHAVRFRLATFLFAVHLVSLGFLPAFDASSISEPQVVASLPPSAGFGSWSVGAECTILAASISLALGSVTRVQSSIEADREA
jgi:hypothetical protein